MKRNNRWIAVSLAFAALLVVGVAVGKLLPSFRQPDFEDGTSVAVSRVIDGDTIVVLRAGMPETVRLIGVDTPETKHPSKPVQFYGKEASLFLTNLLKGENVYLLRDAQQGDKDRYGRRLAYVYRAPDGFFVNAEIIRQGYGRFYGWIPFRHFTKFREFQAFAKKAQKGLWAKRTTAVRLTPPVPRAKPKVEADDQQKVAVYVTRTGRKYHRGHCSYLRKSRIPMSLKAAKAGGYGPCSRCRP